MLTEFCCQNKKVPPTWCHLVGNLRILWSQPKPPIGQDRVCGSSTVGSIITVVCKWRADFKSRTHARSTVGHDQKTKFFDDGAMAAKHFRREESQMAKFICDFSGIKLLPSLVPNQYMPLSMLSMESNSLNRSSHRIKIVLFPYPVWRVWFRCRSSLKNCRQFLARLDREKTYRGKIDRPETAW